MAETLPPSPGVAALVAIPPAIRVLPAGAQLLRVWFSASPHPSGFGRFRHFGPASSRFDHHLPGPGDIPKVGDRGILYVVEEHPDAPITALGKVFQQRRIIDLHHEAPVVSVFRIERDIGLLDLTAHWTTRAGASAALSSGPRTIARGWSRDFYAAYPTIDGLRYRSSMSGGSGISLALFERCADAMPAKTVATRRLDHPEIAGSVTEAAERLGYGIKL
jgi:hypothetical protein